MTPSKCKHNHRHSSANSAKMASPFGKGGLRGILNRSNDQRPRILSAPVFPKTWAILALSLFAGLISPAAQAESLGRLFFTPEQRAQLESRRAHSAATVAATATAATPEEGDATTVLTVNGIVQKQGGARTVWINGVAQNAGNSDERSPESLAVAVPGKSQPVKVKVGQKLLIDIPPQPKPVEQKPAESKPSPPQKPPASNDDDD